MNKINNFYFNFRNKFACCLPALYSFCEKRKMLVKFFVIGSINGILSLFLLYFFHDILGKEVVFSTTASFILSFIFSFIFQKNWTFRDAGHTNSMRQMSSYSINIFITLNVNGFLMYLLVNIFGWWYLFSQVLVNIAISIYNFFVYKYLIFKKRDEIRSL